MAKKTNRQRREEIFVRQSSPLTRFRHPHDGAFVMCPLCLCLRDESFLKGNDLEIEDAPPVQYFGGRQCCLTCAQCNRSAGDSFENRTGLVNVRRDQAIAAARPNSTVSAGGLVLPPPLPRFLGLADALSLAKVSSDERKMELKSAYLIAYATLGHSYVLGPGLDQVREMLEASSDLTDVPICASVDGLSPGKVFVTFEPLQCVIVLHPTKHRRFSTRDHAVFLPVPSSSANFYERLATIDKITGGSLKPLGTEYEQPRARRLPMHWDTDDLHPLRSQSSWQVEYVSSPDPPVIPPFEIRLGEPQRGWVASTI